MPPDAVTIRPFWVALLLLLGVLVLVLITSSRRGNQSQGSLAPEDTQPGSTEVHVAPVTSREESLPQPIPPEAQHELLCVHVADQSAHDLEGARLRVVSVDVNRDEHSGKTDTRGVCSLGAPSLLPAVLSVACDGYVPAEFYLEQSTAGCFEVRLTGASFIEGRVLDRSTGQGLEGLRVLAWPEDLRIPPWELAERALRGGDPRALLATSESMGRFRIEGADPSKHYRMLAAGHGFASFEPTTSIAAGDPGLQVEVGRLYGKRVSLRHPVPERQSMLASQAPRVVNPLIPRVPGASYVWQPSPIPVLAGLQTRTEYGRLSESVYLFVSDSDSPDVGPVDFFLELPGFETVSEKLLFPRAIDRLAEESIQLVSLSQPSSLCRIALVWPQQMLKVGRTSVAEVGRVVLEPRIHASGHGPVTIRVQSGASTEVMAELPCGSYSARFHSTLVDAAHPAAGEPPMELEVRAGMTTEMTMDLSSLGGARIRILSNEDIEISGSFTAVVAKGSIVANSSAVTSAVSFSTAPYVLGPLMPGEYSIVPLGHSSASVSAKDRVELVVHAGMITDTVIRLR